MQIEEFKKQNFDLHLKEKELHNKVCKSGPIILTISDTTICNLNCIMCQKNIKRVTHPILYEAKKIRFVGKIVNNLNNLRLIHYKNANMDFALFEKIAEETFPYLGWIYPTVNGEPFLNRNFYRVLDLIERFRVELILFTNATVIPKDKQLARIMRNLYNLIVSFDAACKPTYEKIRRFAKYEQVIANIKRFNKARKQIKQDKQPILDTGNTRPKLSLKLVLMRSNIEELSDWVKLAKDLEVDRLLVAHIMIFDKELLPESLIYNKQLANYHIKKAKELAQELGFHEIIFPPLYSEGMDAEERPQPVNNNNPCSFLWREAYIESDGNVYPCCGSIKEGLWMGNIKYQTFAEIWNGPRYRSLRESFKTGNLLPQCVNCFHREKFRSSDTQKAFILCTQ